ncbi:hypothetical protein HDU93_006152 [Gonapodya sp. JEL0774]|nr:hypothetical protein HDU93_006152 [Gonapodya sp. JEL0774]
MSRVKTHLLSAEEVGLEEIAKPVTCPRPECQHQVWLKFTDLGWEKEPYQTDLCLVLQTCNRNRNGKKCNARFEPPEWWQHRVIDYSTLHQKLLRHGLVRSTQTRRRRTEGDLGSNHRDSGFADEKTSGDEMQVVSNLTSESYNITHSEVAVRTAFADQSGVHPSFSVLQQPSPLHLAWLTSLPPPSPAPPFNNHLPVRAWSFPTDLSQLLALRSDADEDSSKDTENLRSRILNKAPTEGFVAADVLALHTRPYNSYPVRQSTSRRAQSELLTPLNTQINRTDHAISNSTPTTSPPGQETRSRTSYSPLNPFSYGSILVPPNAQADERSYMTQAAASGSEWSLESPFWGSGIPDMEEDDLSVIVFSGLGESAGSGTAAVSVEPSDFVQGVKQEDDQEEVSEEEDLDHEMMELRDSGSASVPSVSFSMPAAATGETQARPTPVASSPSASTLFEMDTAESLSPYQDSFDLDVRLKLELDEDSGLWQSGQSGQSVVLSEELQAVPSQSPSRNARRKTFSASFQEDCEAGGRIGIENRKKNESKYRADCREGGIKGAKSKRNLRHTSLKTFLLTASEVGLEDIARPVVCPRPECGHSIMLKFVDLGWASEVNLAAHETFASTLDPTQGSDPDDIPDYEPDLRIVIQTCNSTVLGKKCGGRFAKPDWWDGGTIDYSTLDTRLKRNGLVEKAQMKSESENLVVEDAGLVQKAPKSRQRRNIGKPPTPSLHPSPSPTRSHPLPPNSTVSLPPPLPLNDPLDEFFDFSSAKEESDTDFGGSFDFGECAVASPPTNERDDPMDLSSPPRGKQADGGEHFGNSGFGSEHPPSLPPLYTSYFALPPLAPSAITLQQPPLSDGTAPGRTRRINSVPLARPPGLTLARSLSSSARRRVGSPSRPGAPYPTVPTSPSLPQCGSPTNLEAGIAGAPTFDFAGVQNGPPNATFEMVMRELAKGVPPLRPALSGDASQNGSSGGVGSTIGSNDTSDLAAMFARLHPPGLTGHNGLDGAGTHVEGGSINFGSGIMGYPTPNEVFEMVLRELTRGTPPLRHASTESISTGAEATGLPPTFPPAHRSNIAPLDQTPAVQFDRVLTELLHQPPPLRPAPPGSSFQPNSPDFSVVLSELVSHPPPLRPAAPPRVLPAHRGPAQYETVLREMMTRPPVLRTPGRVRGAGGGLGMPGGQGYAPTVPSPLGYQQAGGGPHRRTSSASSVGRPGGPRRSPSVVSVGGTTHGTTTGGIAYDPMMPFTHRSMGSPNLVAVMTPANGGEAGVSVAGVAGEVAGDVYLLPPPETQSRGDCSTENASGVVFESPGSEDAVWMEMVESIAGMSGVAERTGWDGV